MIMQAPKVDKRSYREMVEKAVELARDYCPGWVSIKDPINKEDPGYRMIQLFARLMEILIERLNKIPDKNFLSFLDMVGVEQQAGNPAGVPVTFVLSKTTQLGGEIPAGTQVATTQTDTADAQVFETRQTFYATPAKLKKVINLIPDKESYSKLKLIELPPRLEDLEDESRFITALRGDVSSLQDIDHILYLGSEALFGKKKTIKIELTFLLENNQKDIFTENNLEWKTYNKEKDFWESITVSASDYDKSTVNEVKITLDNFSGTDKSEINEREDYWIACHFIGEFAANIQIAEITSITGMISPPGGITEIASGIDSAFSNSNPIDLSKPFYPFGERPKYGDAFYIGSKEAFSPDVNEVTLTFSILPYRNAELEKIFQNITNPKKVETEVEWQYLDKDGVWQHSTTCVHTLEVAKKTDNTLDISHKWNGSTTTEEDGTFFGIDPNTSDIAELTLTIPADIGLKQWNQRENYWIRALITSLDPYGEDAYYEATGKTIIGPTFIPPRVKSVEVKIKTYKQIPITIKSIQTKNNFEFIDHTRKLEKAKRERKEYSFLPFIPITSHQVGTNKNFFTPEPALYMGFDRAFGDVYISMFMHLKEVASSVGFPLEKGNPHIVWEYVAPDYLWKPLDVEEGTANLTSSGTVAFTGPSDSEKVEVFGLETLYWYRACLAHGKYDHPPEVKGIYLNTVMAANQTRYRQDQVIGSGTGAANQGLLLTRIPVLGGDVWVREPERPSEEELENHRKEFIKYFREKDLGDVKTEDLIEARETTAGGGEEQIWVRWLKVPNFLFSGPRSRHYTLDSIKGEITFGNGEKGLLPPTGKDNIIVRNYQTGGGEKANKVATPLAIKELKSSIPYVDKVFNVQNAVGGSDPWSLEETMEFGPQSIKNRGRAVTIEDYEWMILQQFTRVARTKCIPTRIPGKNGKLAFKPGAATMIIVPKSRDRKPQPSKGLLEIIRDYVREKALGNIFSDIHVIGPKFKEIRIKANVKPKLPEESSIVERRIIKELEAFFHPLTGGKQGKGWDFGRDVYISEVYAVIERTEGVDRVESESVIFIEKPEELSVEVDDNSLAASGIHVIEMV